MNYIVLDLEWNQSIRPEEEVPGLPFEIIEIGAVRLDADLQKTGDFSRLIKPTVYRQMNRVIEALVHLDMKELERAERFERLLERQKFLEEKELYEYERRKDEGV